MAVLPTKGNLLATKRSLTLAKTGYELMDKKRNILIREMMGLVDRARALQEQIDATYQAAYAALELANIAMGICDDAAAGVPIRDGVEILTRSVMGVEIPMVRDHSPTPSLPYSLSTSTSALDDAFFQFQRVRELVTELAELENTIYRLAAGTKKTIKRANALQNIVIPGYETTIRTITAALSEKEREEYSRLKVIKQTK